MKTVVYEVEDFKKRIGSDSSVLFDLTVESRNNPVCAAIINFSLFGVSLAGEIVEYRDEERISLLHLPGGVTFDDAVKSTLDEYRNFAIQTFDARPGRYEDDSRQGVTYDPSPALSEMAHQIYRLEEEYGDLSRRLTRLAAGGCYDD